MLKLDRIGKATSVVALIFMMSVFLISCGGETSVSTLPTPAPPGPAQTTGAVTTATAQAPTASVRVTSPGLAPTPTPPVILPVNPVRIEFSGDKAFEHLKVLA